MDLKCNKTCCCHNDKYCCCAKEILIGSRTDCKTFEKDSNKTPEKLQDVSKDMFESAPDIKSFKHTKDVKINCNASCIFNKDGKCNANGITVLEGSSDGICGTFVKE